MPTPWRTPLAVPFVGRVVIPAGQLARVSTKLAVSAPARLEQSWNEPLPVTLHGRVTSGGPHGQVYG